MGVLDQLIRNPATAVAFPLTPILQDRVRVVEPLRVGAAALDLLSELQQIGALLIVIDDAYWADQQSLEALTFALRRLHEARVLTVVLLREIGDARLPNCLRRLLSGDETLRLTLEGLSAGDLQFLSKLKGCGRLSLCGAERLRAHTLGNPLYARELLEQLPVNAFEATDSPLPAPRSFAELPLKRLRDCAQEVQDLVAAVSVLSTSCVPNQAAALAQIGNPLPALEQAIRLLLVELRDTRAVDFPHPLLRAAVYQSLASHAGRACTPRLPSWVRTK
jgi:hypothetical protein